MPARPPNGVEPISSRHLRDTLDTVLPPRLSHLCAVLWAIG